MFQKYLPKTYKWYHGLIFLILINLLSFAWLVDVSYYQDLNKPWFAPPSWVFGPAWLTNNILVITGNIWALNLFNRLREQPNFQTEKILKTKKWLKIYFWLQALSWVNFIIFTPLSFGTKISSMFFWPTFSMWIITIFSIYFAVKIDKAISDGRFWETVKKGRSISFTFTTLILWLSLASLLGFFVWIKN